MRQQFASAIETVKIGDLRFIRAGSDYLPGRWSANVTGREFVRGRVYNIERADGTTYAVRADRRQNLDNQLTWLLVDAD